MRRLALTFVVLSLAAACGSSAPAPRAPTAQRDAALALIEQSFDLNGSTVGSSNARATIVIVFASWCGHCKAELDVIASVRANHGNTRVLGVNYKGHEEYDGRGNAAAVRTYIDGNVPWLRVVPAEEPLFAALGRPPKVPTIYVYDAAGTLVTRFDRRQRPAPDAAELDALLTRLGA